VARLPRQLLSGTSDPLIVHKREQLTGQRRVRSYFIDPSFGRDIARAWRVKYNLFPMKRITDIMTITLDYLLNNKRGSNRRP
jgi:hypothetical protein